VEPPVFRHHHRVTYADCAPGNHVYYGRYLEILEAARGEFLRHLGQPFLRWQEADVIFPVVECRLRYKGAARYDDVLTVETRLTGLRRAQLEFTHRIVNESGALLLEASTLHACASTRDKLQRIPDELAAALRPWLHETPVA
jgi:acyl-CoA thioester hydrolase